MTSSNISFSSGLFTLVIPLEPQSRSCVVLIICHADVIPPAFNDAVLFIILLDLLLLGCEYIIIVLIRRPEHVLNIDDLVIILFLLSLVLNRVYINHFPLFGLGYDPALVIFPFFNMVFLVVEEVFGADLAGDVTDHQELFVLRQGLVQFGLAAGFPAPRR
eukprot:CAMPEP_0168340864 /NCGR_PEP_ID=MMETSP0213-20121227/14321_1 /TAXON_ID=151035 /ORGANISM="Euplotes harpa, Strain FSP1.4" /LENGTH=160 /DNA_ID=CAMNT_0008347189 /DNA_START=278 /DNA_END=757 /DNA_ORIENTATION=-